MKGRLARWVAAPVLVVMLGLIVVLAVSDPGGDAQASSPLLGRQAPAVTGDSLAGASYDLETRRGEFVLVNFFATWCVPCIVEHPELVEFERRHARIGDASVVSVVYADRPNEVREFFADNGGDWPVVLDPDGSVAVSYGVAKVPESYLVGPDGTVVTKFTGGVTAAGLDRALRQAQEVR